MLCRSLSLRIEKEICYIYTSLNNGGLLTELIHAIITIIIKK